MTHRNDHRAAHVLRTRQRSALLLSALGAATMLATAASAQVVFNFNDLPSTAKYSVALGNPIGSTIFAQDGVPVRLAPYGTSTTGQTRANPPFVSGFTTQNLWISNIGTKFDVSALDGGHGAGIFRFQCRNQGGTEMIAVNGSRQIIGNNYSAFPFVIGGATLRVLSGAPNTVRTVEIRGFLNDVTLGGQEYSIDNVEILPPECPCTADFDGSGGTPDVTDVAAFFGAWNEGAEIADVNCSGGTPDGGDIERFFRDWLAGGCIGPAVIQDFEGVRSLPPTVWSTATGFPPESVILEEKGIRIRVMPATKVGGATVFGNATVSNLSASPFLAKFVQGSEIAFDLDFTRLPFVPSRVAFDFAPGTTANTINLRINGSTMYVGPLSSAVPITQGGIMISYQSADARGGSLPGRFILTGPVQRVLIGSPDSCKLDNITAD